MMMANTSNDLSRLATRYTSYLKESLKEELVSVVLFGSVARGEASLLSDIDVLIIVENYPRGRLARLKLLEKATEKIDAEIEALWESGVYTDFMTVIKDIERRPRT